MYILIVGHRSLKTFQGSRDIFHRGWNGLVGTGQELDWLDSGYIHSLPRVTPIRLLHCESFVSATERGCDAE